jgi:hypothetical protein
MVFAPKSRADEPLAKQFTNYVERGDGIYIGSYRIQDTASE